MLIGPTPPRREKFRGKCTFSRSSATAERGGRSYRTLWCREHWRSRQTDKLFRLCGRVCWSAFEPLARRFTDRFHVVRHAAERPIAGALDLLIRQREEVHPHGREVVGIFLQRLRINGVSLTVEPADRPVVPTLRPPADAAGVFMRVLFQLSGCVIEA